MRQGSFPGQKVRARHIGRCRVPSPLALDRAFGPCKLEFRPYGRKLPMNILQLISSGGLYGAESMVLHLSRVLRDRGENVTLGLIVNERNPHREIAEKARQAGLEAVEITCGGRLDVGTVRRLRELIKTRRAHIIHSHGYKSNLYALAIKRASRLPLVSTCHNWTNQTAALRVYGILVRLAL